MPAKNRVAIDIFTAIKRDFESAYAFEVGDQFSWSYRHKTILYPSVQSPTIEFIWSLLHELGHAAQGHRTYRDDLELLMMEVAAWKEAKRIAVTYELDIDDEYIESSIDTYRSWLHKRSTCIECTQNSFPLSQTKYRCFNCNTEWQVPASRLCAIRRRKVA